MSGTRATGKWPRPNSGRIPGTGGVTWGAVGVALAKGRSGLPAGFTLAQLRAVKRRRAPSAGPAPIHRAKGLALGRCLPRTHRGRWPRRTSGTVAAPLKLASRSTTLSVSGSEDFLADHRCGDSWHGTAASAMKGTCRRWTSARSCDGRTPIAGAAADGRATARVRLPTHKARLVGDQPRPPLGASGAPGWIVAGPPAGGAARSANIGSLPASASARSCAGRTLITPGRANGPFADRARFGSAGETWVAVENALRQGSRRSSGRLISHPIASQEPRDPEPRPAPAPQHPPDTRLG